MAFNLDQISATGLASATANTVAIGPILIDRGRCVVSLVAKTASGTITTPTNPKIQFSHNPLATSPIWVDVTSGSVTVSSSSSTASYVQPAEIICRAIRVVTAGAFAAGDATLLLQGVETG